MWKRIKSFFRTLEWRFVSAYLTIIVVAFVVLSLSMLQMIGEFMFDQRVREETRVASEIALRSKAHMKTRNLNGLYALVQSFSVEYSARIFLLDANGIVQVDSSNQLNGYPIPLKQVQNALSMQPTEYRYFRSDALNALLPGAGIGESITGVCVCGVEGGGCVVFFSAHNEIYQGLKTVLTRLFVTLLLVFLVVGVVSYAVAKLFTRPLVELNKGIRQMGKGVFSTRVRVKGNSVFTDLAMAFNTMCQRMETLDRSRNQFVSNASHELKTPLATLKILVQSILYQEVPDPALTKEFMTDIDKEIDRLSAVIGDLLSLVHIDSGEYKLTKNTLDLRALLTENIKRLGPLARESGITLNYNMHDQPNILGDPIKLTQVFYNLIDNAIKYTPRGGTVTVDLIRQGKTAITHVTDNGIGIPKDDQLHIFDRFYRVDKARTRKTGGTGLGLSIVKQIVLLHNGVISVDSQEGKGTTFTVELPIQ